MKVPTGRMRSVVPKKSLEVPCMYTARATSSKKEKNISNSNGFTDRMTVLQRIITRNSVPGIFYESDLITKNSVPGIFYESNLITKNSVPGIFYKSNLMQGRIVIILLALEYYDSEQIG